DPTVQQLIPLPSGSSFPSGHTASSFTAAWILWKADRKFGAAGLALAVCIGFSRLYLFVHYPTDVLGGAVLGIACAQGIYLLAKRYMRKKACQ
ncbi:MAG: phosphatase PAP2 family protein, partial [[Clostridium] leptum]